MQALNNIVTFLKEENDDLKGVCYNISLLVVELSHTL